MKNLFRQILMLLIIVLIALLSLSLLSDDVKAITLDDKYVGVDKIDLEWTRYDGADFEKYEIYRNGTYIDEVNNQDTTCYRDSGLVTDTEYEYKVIVKKDGGGSESSGDWQFHIGNVHGTLEMWDDTWNDTYVKLTGDVILTRASNENITLEIFGANLEGSGGTRKIRGNGYLKLRDSDLDAMGLYIDCGNYSLTNNWHIGLINGNRDFEIMGNNGRIIQNNLTNGYVLKVRGNENLIEGNEGRLEVYGENNTLESNKADKIFVQGSSNFIFNNTVDGSDDDGISIDKGDRSVIRGNKISNASDAGLYCLDSYKNVLIEKNTIENCSEGILPFFTLYQGEADNYTFNENTCKNNGNGLHVWDIVNSSIWRNVFEKNNRGIYIHNGRNINITENWISDSSGDGLVAPAIMDSMVIGNNILNNGGNGVEIGGHNIIMDNNDCTSNGGNGFDLVISGSIILDNEATYNENGIFLSSSENITLENNTVSYNSEKGIHLHEARAEILRNNLESNKFGMYIENSDNVTVSDNNINQGEKGIYIRRGEYHNITGNRIVNWTNRGIHLHQALNGDPGNSYTGPCYIDIRNNTITGKESKGRGIESRGTGDTRGGIGYGIQISYVDLINVSGNQITTCERGIDLNAPGGGALDNMIYMNTVSDFTGTGISMSSSQCKNSTIAWNTISTGYTGILISGTNCRVMNNTISKMNDIGIQIGGSENTISGNSIKQSGILGIWVNYGKNAIIKENEIRESTENGLVVDWGSDHITVLHNDVSFNQGSGIVIRWADNCTLSSNTIDDNRDHGIYLLEAPDNTIFRNILNRNYVNGYGIFLNDSAMNQITENQIYLSKYEGVHLLDSSSNLIMGNTIQNNYGNGIRLLNSNDVIIENNNLKSNYEHGILVDTTNTNTEIDNNTADGNTKSGFFIDSDDIGSFTGNSASENKWDGFLFGENSENITLADSVISKNIQAGIRILGKHITVFNNSIRENYDGGIIIDNTTLNRVEKNEIFDNNWSGVAVLDSDEITIKENSIEKNYEHGILLTGSTHNYILDNYLSMNYHTGHGIFLNRSDGNWINDNEVYKSKYDGIRSEHSSGNSYSGNRVDENYRHGLSLYNSHNNTLDENHAKLNFGDGFQLTDSNDNELLFNDAEENKGNGFTVGCQRDILNENIATMNEGSGFHLSGGKDHSLTNNSATNNQANGFLINNGAENMYLENNKGEENENSGITIYSSGNHVIVQNEVVRNEMHGLDLQRVQNCGFEKNSAIENEKNGFSLIGVQDCNFTNNIAFTNKRNGFSLDSDTSPDLYTRNNILNANNASENQESGFQLIEKDTMSNQLSDNIALKNRESGFTLDECGENTLSGNTANDNDLHGFSIENSLAMLNGNLATSNVGDGYNFQQVPGGIVEANRASQNTDGFRLENTSLVILRLNNASMNPKSGFRIIASDQLTIDRNGAAQNDENGVILDRSVDNTLSHNKLYRNDDCGIYLDDSDRNSIHHNQLLHESYGMRLSSSTVNTILNNTFYNMTVAFLTLDNSDFNYFMYNDLNLSKDFGIRIKTSMENNISHNVIIKVMNDVIQLESADDSYILDNSICDSGTASDRAGIYVRNCQEVMIADNEINDVPTGLRMETCTECYVSGNELNLGKSLGDHHTTKGIHLQEDVATCEFVNNVISYWKQGIYLEMAIEGCSFTGNEISNNVNCGILVENGNNGVMHNNVIWNNGINAITMAGADLEEEVIEGWEIKGNTLLNNQGCGIFIDFVKNTEFSGNSVEVSGENGVSLSNSTSVQILDNTVQNNVVHGIYLFNSDTNLIEGNTVKGNGENGIDMSTSIKCSVDGNTIESNEDGIALHVLFQSRIVNNTITMNTESGMSLFNADNNLIYNNHLENDNNAEDNGDNQWYIDKTAGVNIIGGPYLGGNFWHDYEGEDTNNDGLGDTFLPYNASGKIVTDGDFHPLTPVSGGKPVHNLNTTEDFATIQEAIDDPETIDGHVIEVDDGEYTENVVVNKRLTIRSGSGTDVCRVSAADENDFVFTLAVDQISIVGFTITNAAGDPAGGILIDGVSGVIIMDCDISGNTIGILCENNGNADIHWNSINDNILFGLENRDDSVIVNAENNWWGDGSGPGGAGTGTGDNVSEYVDFTPWLGADVIANDREQVDAGQGIIDMREETNIAVDYDTTRGLIITTLEYGSNPGDGFTGDLGKYVDVHIDTSDGVDELVIKLYYTDGELGEKDETLLEMMWYDGTEWKPCSDTGVDTDDEGDYSGFIWVKIRTDTTPSLSNMSGTPFGAVEIEIDDTADPEEEDDDEGIGAALAILIVVILVIVILTVLIKLDILPLKGVTYGSGMKKEEGKTEEKKEEKRGQTEEKEENRSDKDKQENEGVDKGSEDESQEEKDLETEMENETQEV